MLLHRYSDFDAVMQMPLDIGAELIEQAKAAQREERLHLQWAIQIPYMEEFVPFNEYVDRCTGRNVDLRPTSAILNEIAEAEKELCHGS